MERAGTALGTAQGLVVVRSTDDRIPDIGTELVDDSLDEVGAVVDVFGPVERPFLAVSPTTDQPALLVGNPLYTRN